MTNLYLKEYLIKMCDLPEFIETESGCMLKWRGEDSACCECPMPDHAETKPSFHINRLDEEVWVYHCFGCNKKGTIIQFCMDFFGFQNQSQAIDYLCKYYNVKNVDDLILEGMKNISKKVNSQRKIENENILVSNQCRMLLRKNNGKNKEWVMDAYKRLNFASNNLDSEEIEKIGAEASRKLREKSV